MGVIAKGILRGCQGLFTPVSLGYPLSVFNKNSTLNTAKWKLKRESSRKSSKDQRLFPGSNFSRATGVTLFYFQDTELGSFVLRSHTFYF